jgi:S-formylglutathione hydrolase FrmB
MALSRRSLLVGGLVGLGTVGALTAAGIVTARTPGPAREDDDGEPPTSRTSPPAGPSVVVTGSFVSQARLGVRTGWVLALPAGTDPDDPRTPDGKPLPVCVVLHGRTGSSADLTDIGYHLALAQVVRAGTAPFALVAADGGDRYWHPRAAGDDSGAMVTEELLPAMAARGLAAGPDDRLALLGWSMGAYGALLLASERGPERTAAVAAASPALFPHAADTPAGAFDDREDYLRHDVWSRRPLLSRMPLRIDCGKDDPFAPATRQFTAGIHPTPAGGTGQGRHNKTYWRLLAPTQLRFVGAHVGAG